MFPASRFIKNFPSESELASARPEVCHCIRGKFGYPFALVFPVMVESCVECCEESLMSKRASAGAKRQPVECHRSLRNLSAALADSNSADDVCGFLKGILTPPERARIALRWELVKLLQRGGVSQRRVGQILRVSLCKITRGARELKDGPPGFSRIVKKGLVVERRGV